MDLELPPFSILLITFLLLISMVLKREKRIKTNGSTSNLPPAPLKLPIIGNLHNLVGCLPHHGLRDLAKKYGPLMHLQLGELSTVVVPSPKFGREVMKSHDIVFASRPHNLTTRIISYDSNDIAFSPYGDYRKQLQKICISELLSPKRVLSYRSIREEEVFDFINRIASKAGSPVNLTNKTYSLIYGITTRAAFGKKCKDQDLFISAARKAITSAAELHIADLFPSMELLQSITGLKSRAREAASID